MPDRHSLRLFLHPQSDALAWEATRQTWALATAFFEAQIGSGSVRSYAGSSADGEKNFERTSLASLEQAFANYRAQPRSVDAFFHSESRPERVTTLWLQVWFSGDRSEISIDVSGPDRLAVERFALDLKDELAGSSSLGTLLTELPTARELRTSSYEGDESGAVAATAERHVLSSSAPPHDNDPQAQLHRRPQGWLARTWRDHTAGLVLAVLASVVSAVVLTLLGLNQ